MYLYTVEELDFYAQCHCLFRAEPNRVAQFLFAAADFAEITTIHPPGKMAIREAAAVLAVFPVIAAADPLGGAAMRETAAMNAAVNIAPSGSHHSSSIRLFQESKIARLRLLPCQTGIIHPFDKVTLEEEKDQCQR